jgi:hypothetical protein
LLMEKNELMAKSHQYRVAEQGHIRRAGKARNMMATLPGVIENNKEVHKKVRILADEARKAFPGGKVPDEVTYNGQSMARTEAYKEIVAAVEKQMEQWDRQLAGMNMGRYREQVEKQGPPQAVYTVEAGPVRLALRIEQKTNYVGAKALNNPGEKLVFDQDNTLNVAVLGVWFKDESVDESFGSASGNPGSWMTRIANRAIDKILARPDGLAMAIAQDEKELEEYRGLAKEPFKYRREMAEANRRIAEIDAELVTLSRNAAVDEDESAGPPVLEMVAVEAGDRFATGENDPGAVTGAMQALDPRLTEKEAGTAQWKVLAALAKKIMAYVKENDITSHDPDAPTEIAELVDYSKNVDGLLQRVREIYGVDEGDTEDTFEDFLQATASEYKRKEETIAYPYQIGGHPDFRRAEAGRERAVGLEDVRAEFAGKAATGLNPDGSVWVKAPGGAQVTIRLLRRVDDGGVAVAVEVGGDEILGRYFEGEIHLQRDKAGVTTLRHEIEHFLERAGLLRAPEIGALRRHVRALVEKGKWKPFDAANPGGMEDRAEWVARWINRRETMHGTLRKMLDRVADFLAGLWNVAARTLGMEQLTTARGVLGDIASGRVFERQALKKDLGGEIGAGQGPDFMFAGPKAKGAARLEDAKRMKADGASREQVWNDTGWWQGPDGAWRFEIDDSKAAINFKSLKPLIYPKAIKDEYGNSELVSLKDVLKDDDLFEAYPWLNDVMVQFSDESLKGASFRPKNDILQEPATISLSWQTPTKDVKTLVFHEIQHAIQDKEGFARGGSPDDLVTPNDFSKASRFARNEAAQKKAKEDLAAYVDALSREKAKKKTLGVFGGPDKKNVAQLESLVRDAERDVEENEAYLKKEYGLEKASLYRAMNAIERDLGAAWAINRVTKVAGLERLYKSLTGEAESRLVQRRLDMTAEQRKAEPPWVTLEKMLREEGLLKEGQKPEDVLISRKGGVVAESRPEFKPVDVNSKEFKLWFGDSVVTVDGKPGSEPLRVFHGTALFPGEERNVFSDSERGRFTHEDRGATEGFFFTESEGDAEYYAGRAADRAGYKQATGEGYEEEASPRVLPLYLSVKKPLVLDGSGEFSFLNDDNYAAIKYAKENGYDGVYVENGDNVNTPGTWIAFSPTQIKSAISNVGQFSDTDPDIRFRRRSQAAAEIEADTFSFFEKAKLALRPARLTEKPAADLNYVRDLLMRTPAFFAQKIAGTKQIYRAAQRKRDETEQIAYGMENHGTVNAVRIWDSLGDAGRERTGKYLVDTDAAGGGYRVRRSSDGGHWQVEDEAGKVQAHFESRPDPADPYADIGENEAAAKRRELEAEALRQAGYTADEIAVVVAFRTSTDKGFSLLVREMRRAETIAKQAGDEEIRVTVVGDDKAPERITLAQAMARMGDLRGHYFPRIRKRARFVLKAEKEGQANRREHFTTGQMMNVRAEALRRAGWTVTTEKATETGEDVFALEGSLIKTQQLVAAAMEKVEHRMKAAGALDNDAMAEVAASVQAVFESGLAEQIAAVMRGRGARGRMIRRDQELWQGYETDAQLVLAKYIRGLAGAEAKRRMTVRMMRALTGTAVSRRDFELAVGFGGDYESFVDEHGRARTDTDETRTGTAGREMLEDPEALTAEVFEAINDPAGVEENRTAIADLEAMLKKTTDEDERKTIGKNLAEKKRWMAERYQQHVEAMRIDQRQSPNAFKWAKAFIEENTRNPELADRVIGMFRGLAVGKYLAFRVFSAPVVNLTALPTSVIATLKAAGIPYADAWRLLGGALADYLTYRRGGKFADAEKQRVFDHIRENGWDAAQFNSEAMSALRGALGRTWDKTIEYGMLTFAESERLNRAATIAAAYHGLKAQHPELEFEDLMERARKTSDDAHGVYNKGNYPYLALGRHPAAHVARMFNVFKVFAHTYFQNMARIGFEEKDYGALAHMVLAPAVIAGLGASAMMPLVHLVARAFGADEPEEELYATIGETFGATAESLARHGVTGQIGFTVKGSMAVGVGDLPTNMRDLIGAPGSVIMDLYRAMGFAGRGDWLKAMEAAAPTGAGNIVKAVRERTEGVTTASNRPVFWGKEQLRPTLAEAFWRGFGFNPTRMATIRERQWKEVKVAELYSERKADIYARFRSYAAEGQRDPAELAEIMGQVAAFNEDAARWDIAPITVKRLEAAAEARPDRRERERGAADEADERLADPGSEAGGMIAALTKGGHLELRPPSRRVVYRHRSYEMPEAAWKLYQKQSAEHARRKLAGAVWRLKGLPPERQAEEIQKIVTTARRRARHAARRAALAAGPVGAAGKAAEPTDQGTRRPDGTPKGTGFLGVLKRPDGNVSTELSAGVTIDGKEVLLPLLVPTLDKQQIDWLLAGNEPTQQILDLAVDHAIARMNAGLSPFAN